MSGTVTGIGINCGADCTETYDSGTPVTLTATPDPDSTFTSWTNCDSVSGNICTITMNANKSVTATFNLTPIDTTFNPNANDLIYSIAVQPDGKVLVGGNFTSVGGESRDRLARLNPDGTLDASFNTHVYDGVFSITIQPDGKILYGGVLGFFV